MAPGGQPQITAASAQLPCVKLVRLCHCRRAAGNLLRRPAAARTIGTTGGRRNGAMSQSRRSLQQDGPAFVGLEFAASLLPMWGFPPGTGISPVGERGTNNRTSWYATGSGATSCGSRVPVRRGSLRRAPDPAAAAAGRPSPPGAGARGRTRRADSDRDPGWARRRLPVAARRTSRHGQRGRSSASG